MSASKLKTLLTGDVGLLQKVHRLLCRQQHPTQGGHVVDGVGLLYFVLFLLLWPAPAFSLPLPLWLCQVKAVVCAAVENSQPSGRQDDVAGRKEDNLRLCGHDRQSRQ